MRKINRRKAIGVVAIGLPALITRRATAAETVLKFANSNAVDHPINIRLKEAAAQIREKSGAARWPCPVEHHRPRHVQADR